MRRCVAAAIIIEVAVVVAMLVAVVVVLEVAIVIVIVVLSVLVVVGRRTLQRCLSFELKFTPIASTRMLKTKTVSL